MSSGAGPSDPANIGTTSLELRILSGAHAGAKIRLPAGDTGSAPSLSMGPGMDHDVVLSDAPGSAQLRLEAGTWRWTETDFEAELGSGCGWRWGSLVIGMASAGAPWAMPARLLFDRSRAPQVEALVPSADASQDASTPAHAVHSASAVPADDGSALQSNPPDASPPVPTPARPAGRRLILVAAMAAVFIALIGSPLIFRDSREPAAPPTSAAPTALAPPEAVDPTALGEALARAGLDRRVRVIPLPDGRMRLSGVVADDDELDRTIAAVRRVTRRIVQGVLTQREFSARVSELQAETPQPVTLRAAPVGRVLLVDADRPGVDLEALKAWVARSLPEALEIAVLDRARLAEVEAPAPVPIQRPSPAPVPVAAIPVLPTVAPNEPPLPDLPEIRLVMGGASPYVVLGSGEKWLPGGRVGDWYLSAIEAQALILEDTRGRQIRSPR